MALMNLITKIPYSYLELTKKIITLIPKKFKQFDIIVDNYKESENQSKKRGDWLEIASFIFKVPGDFRVRVLYNCCNKARVIELIFEYIKKVKEEFFKTLR